MSEKKITDVQEELQEYGQPEAAEVNPQPEKLEEPKVNTLTLLHCSDIHLDAPTIGLPAEKSEERRKALRTAFNTFIQLIKERNIDFVLMSGDIFNNEYVTNTTAELLIHGFESCPKTHFVITPGKHDCYNGNPIYSSGRLPDNCFVFNSEKLSRYDVKEFPNVIIYGWAFMDPEMRVNPLYDKQVDDSTRINIVCGYADLDGEVGSDSCPISLEDLKKFGADYCALGSRHQSTDFLDAGASKYSYSGSLTCTGFDEPGFGGVKMIKIKYSDGEQIDICSEQPKLDDFAHEVFITKQIDITGVNSNNEIIGKISELIETVCEKDGESAASFTSKRKKSDTALRVELVGYVDPYFSALTDIDGNVFGLYYFEVIDKTVPLYGTEHFKRDMTMKGEVFRTFYNSLHSSNEEERLQASKAFRIALAALDNKELPS